MSKVLTWDAFGYYIYLPGIFIYKDIKQMDWVTEIVNKYNTTGPIYQLSKPLPNGNKSIKYLIGVSLLYSPFFLISHNFASWLNYPQDGFSAPYQIGICLAALFYAFLGLYVLRWVLLQYFSDSAAAFSLILIALATNYPQYVSVESGMSHGYIFSLYAFLLAATIKWHHRPAKSMAFILGGIVGLGIISRPTEAVMIFIPLFYGTQDAIKRKEKWALVAKYRTHLVYCAMGGALAISPQLIYWKVVTGNWIYDVGSKWTFLQPNWQVLFGWEKGWFIYTPVVVLLVFGILYFRKNPFYKSVLFYFILNLWIVIAWFDWRYGASYSARALIQSYAVLSLPLAAMIQKLLNTRTRYLLFGLFIFLIYLNIFQIWQYNKTILHYNDMNRRYYQAIFLNPNPSPLEMSLLDTKEYIRNEDLYSVQYEIKVDSQYVINVETKPKAILYALDLQNIPGFEPNSEQWLRIKASVMSSWGAFDSNLITILSYDAERSKQTSCRMQNGISENGKMESNRILFRDSH
jgi:hypothetical protein